MFWDEVQEQSSSRDNNKGSECQHEATAGKRQPGKNNRARGKKKDTTTHNPAVNTSLKQEREKKDHHLPMAPKENTGVKDRSESQVPDKKEQQLKHEITSAPPLPPSGPPSDFEDELEMVLSMYPDELSLVNTSSSSCWASVLKCSLLGGFQLDIMIPKCGYPATVRPSAEVSKGPNERSISRLDRLVRILLGVITPTPSSITTTGADPLFEGTTLDSPNTGASSMTANSSSNNNTTNNFRLEGSIEAFPLGEPCLMQLIQFCQQEIDVILSERESEEEAKRLEAEEYKKISELEEDESNAVFQHKKTSSGIAILAGSNIIGDRKSKFMAHVANVSSEAHIPMVVDQLRTNRSIASAAHPAIWAYRFTDKKTGKLHSDNDDDGETGASKKMMFLMESMKVDGYLVVVTRWYGGIHLGPDRFKHICTVSKDAIQEHCPGFQQ